MDFGISFQRYIGSIIPDTFLSASTNIFLNFVTGLQAGTLSDDSGKLSLGETATINGNDFVFRGSGTAQPGVDLLGLVIPLGSARDVLLFEEASTGNLFFVYPDGPPNLLGAIALVIDIDEVGYSLSTNGPICFCRGTFIETPSGERAVETLRADDLVLDWTGTPLRILWTGHVAQQAPLEAFPPIVIEPGALGAGLPRRRLRVSPWHRIPLPGTRGDLPLLAPAKSFTVLPRVRQSRSGNLVEYHHILTERHALIRAEGQPTETLLPARMTLRSLDGNDVATMLDALGCDAETLAMHPAARPCGRLLTMSEARALLKRIAPLLLSGDGGIARARP